VKPRVLSAFAHFTIMHGIVTRMNDLGSRNPYGATDAGEIPQDSSGYIIVDDETRAIIVEVQYSLHNWLQCWLVCPEASQKTDDLPFLLNPLPFYWMAQVSLMAYQKGLPPLGPAFAMKGDEKFKLMKEWLIFIRGFLERGEQNATMLLDELMKIRLRNWQLQMGGGGDKDEQDGGVIAFFPEN
jgi:hypothetical protein